MSPLPQLQEFRHSLPELRYLSVYDGLSQKPLWTYDYNKNSFLTPNETGLEPQSSFGLSDFVSEVVQYDDFIECSLRCDTQVISCISDRNNITFKLLELWLVKQREDILGLDVEGLKIGQSVHLEADTNELNKSKAASKKAKKTALSESAKSTFEAPSDWLQLRFPGAVQLKTLPQRHQKMAFQIQNTKSGETFLARVFPTLRFKAEAWPEFASACVDPAALADYQLAEVQPGFTLLQRPWLKAVSLQDLVLRMGAVPLHQSLLLLSKIQHQLDRYHAQNQVHANLHPENIFFDKNHDAILVDAGLTRMNSRVNNQPQAFALLAGNPLFLAPEQLLNQEHTAASDRFALGVVMLYMLLGQELFKTLTAYESVEERVKEMHEMASLTLQDQLKTETLNKILDLCAFSVEKRPDNLISLLKEIQIVKKKSE